MDYLTVEEAINAPGLRLVLTAGVPGPWGEAAKSILAFKGLTFTPVLQRGGGDNEALMAWTGQTSAPVAVYENLAPICHWFDLLMLSERLAPQTPLVPADSAERVDVMGLSALIAGANGFGWNRRLHMLAPMLLLEEPLAMAVNLGDKYGWSQQAYAESTPILEQISAELDARLVRQLASGREYLVGEAVTAADFYWASFSGMIKPLGPQDNPMPDFMRTTYETADEATLACLTPRLEAHRDMMYQRHIALPLDF